MTRWNYALCAGLLLVACSTEQERNPGKGEAALLRQAAMQKPDNSNPSGTKESSYQITFFPTTPGMLDDLQVQVSGCNAPTTYRWQINGKIVEQGNSARLTHGSYQRDDTVTATINCGGEVSEATIVISNTAPVIDEVRIKGEGVVTGEPIEAEVTAHDADGDPVDIIYKWQVNGKDIPGESGPILPSGAAQSGDKIGVTVTATDQWGPGKPLTGKVFLVQNAPPHFTSRPPDNFQSETYRYRAVAVDPDNDILTYRVAKGPDQMQIDEKTGEIRWPVSLEQGSTAYVRITASDPQGNQAVQEFTISVSGKKAP